MSRAIDFHSHILPGIDDGSASLQESLSMLQMEREQGITRVVATPHFYAGHDRPETFLDRRDRAEEQLRREMEQYSDMPQIVIGAEVYYFRGISSSDWLRKLTIRGTACVMIEMPDTPWPATALQELSEIHRRFGLVPIIAHIDRYIAPLRSHGIPGKLSQMPVLVQANGDFFLRRSTAAMALRMLREDHIHLLGSDCHNLTSRAPNLGDARAVIQRRIGETALERIDSYGADVLHLADQAVY